jgi:hypothetical protein
VVGALRRAHAHPNRLVHPHLLAVAYLQSGVSANCRPGDWTTYRRLRAKAQHLEWAMSAAAAERFRMTPEELDELL